MDIVTRNGKHRRAFRYRSTFYNRTVKSNYSRYRCYYCSLFALRRKNLSAGGNYTAESTGFYGFYHYSCSLSLFGSKDDFVRVTGFSTFVTMTVVIMVMTFVIMFFCFVVMAIMIVSFVTMSTRTQCKSGHEAY